MIIALSVAVIVVMDWHDYWKTRKIKRRIKVLEMTPVQKRKYKHAQQAKQECKARRKLKPTLKPENDPEPN